MDNPKYRYNELTWLGIRETFRKQPVGLLPLGAVEDHEPHPSYNTDNLVVNINGSSANIADLDARKVALETRRICGTMSSDVGGVAHTGE